MDIDENGVFVTKIVETSALNILGRLDVFTTACSRLERFQNQERNFLKAVCREFYVQIKRQ